MKKKKDDNEAIKVAKGEEAQQQEAQMQQVSQEASQQTQQAAQQASQVLQQEQQVSQQELRMSQQVQEILDLTNDLQRTRADFENFRRRTEERQEAAKQSAQLSTVYKILPLLDDLDRAIATYEELAPLAKSLDKTLKELGIELVSAKPGEEFNPDVHEAVSAEGEGEKEVIGEVLREGYYYENELLRPAMIKVKRTE